MKKIIVIGGGAAGMMAAITAAGNNNKVVLVEKNEKLGKKIFITGKGRCNFTNAGDSDDLMNSIVTNKKFMYSSLNKFSNYDAMGFFGELGLDFKVERGNRVFPTSDHSSDVISALNREMKNRGVEIRLNTKAVNINTSFVSQENDDNNNDKRKIKFESLTVENEIGKKEVITGDELIIATGGNSYQSTGSTGDGYKFAKSLGHTVTPILPALVPFNVKEEWERELQGLSLKNVNVRILDGEKEVYSDFGEMLFTHFGVSGPTILSASSYAAGIIKQKNLITDADDASFEKADNFTANNKIVDSVSSTKDDKKSGAACAHWYNAGTDVAEAEITYKNAITLASGEYIFEYAGQGADGDQLYAKAVDSKGNVIAKGDNVTLAGWKNWKTPSVSFKLDKETEVTLVVGIVSAKGGWGTADDLYLYQTKSADKSDADNGNTGDDDNNKPNPPSADDNNKDNTGSGDTATQPAKALTPGAVVSSTSDTKTTVKDTKGILPDTVKFESKKVTDEKKVAKVADVVKDKIVGVKAVSIYELNLTDGATQLHQLADKVQVTMDMPFALADNEAIKVFRVDSDKLIACTSRVADGKLVFETDHFSTFAFVKVNTNAGTKAAPAGAAKTSDDSNMYMWLVIAMAGLGVSIAALMNRKKEQV